MQVLDAARPALDSPGMSVMMNKLRGHWGKYILAWGTRDDAPSDVPLTVMIPLAPKDMDRARLSVPMIRQFVAHPIERIVIAAPLRPEIQGLCDDLGVDFLDEAVPLTDLVGSDAFQAMNGWHRQQMLKLVAPDVLGAERVLTFDSDTYPRRPTRFVDGHGRAILYTADPDVTPYHRFTEALIGPAPASRTSYIAHCMLFERRWLAALYAAIQAHTGKPWSQAMLDTIARPFDQVGAMSEFDLYGHFLLRDHPHAFRSRYFANVKLKPTDFYQEAPQPWWRRRFRFISNHQHGD